MIMSKEIRFDGRVVIITGAGNGLGRDYALYFGARGAKVVVNDLGGSTSGDGKSTKAADDVVNEIKQAGGQAVANYDSVENGEAIVKTAVQAFGKVDIVINNAGILRDVSFQKMKKEDWDIIFRVHVNGAMSVTKAAWDIMRDQGFGRIINTSSSSGMFGNFGQANYSAAKAALHGFTLTLAKEGAKKNVLVNTICPMAASRLTKSAFPPHVYEALKPEYIVPLVAYLCHDSCTDTGNLYEAGGGWVSKLRLQRAEGAQFNLPYTAEELRDRWSEVGDFERKNDYPTGATDTYQRISDNLERIEAENEKKQKAPVVVVNALKADAIFTMMRVFLERGEGKALVPKVAAVFGFDILKAKGGPIAKSYTIDLKNGQGSVKEGKTEGVDATFQMVDDDFEQVCLGKLQPQTAFMKGQMKIKGNMKKANLFTPELFPPPTPENIAKYTAAKL